MYLALCTNNNTIGNRHKYTKFYEKISPFNLPFSFCQLNSSRKKETRCHGNNKVGSSTNNEYRCCLNAARSIVPNRTSQLIVCVPVRRTHVTVIIIVVVIIVLSLRFDLRIMMICSRSMNWLINIFYISNENSPIDLKKKIIKNTLILESIQFQKSN